MNRERDEPRDRHRARPAPAGREVLEKEIVAVFGAMALDMAERQRENRQRAALAASAAEIVQEARERERAAGRPVDPGMTLGDALEILGR